MSGFVFGLVSILAFQAYAAQDIPLAQVDASFIGEADFDNVGYSISPAGDVNGDGYDDILFGSLNDYNLDGQGHVFLILGRNTGWAPDMPVASADASFVGVVEHDTAVRVAGGHDVNGDQLDDFFIGAPYAAGPYGKVYLVLGRTQGWAMFTSLATADASWVGEGASDFAGSHIATAEDVNGDGFDDLVVGVNGNDESGQGAGQVYLVFGQDSGWESDVSLGLADASFLGEYAGDDAGITVAGLGDVNGDGLGDVLIGAPFNNEMDYHAGQIYLVLGKTSGWAMDVSLAEADASFLGETYSEWAGYDTVSAAGDVNGDGLADFLIGVPNNDEAVSSAGQAYLVLGKAQGWTTDTPLGGVDGSFLGQYPSDGLGGSIHTAGDIDGDGYNEILAVAANDPTGLARIFVLMGQAAGWAMDTPITTAGTWFVEEGPDETHRCMGAGDVNGDGYDDLIFAAPQNSQMGYYSGKVYLAFGGPCLDADQDGYGDPGAYLCPTGHQQDCDDTNPALHPGAEEVCNGGTDDDCDPTTDENLDGDGDGISICDGDCDDTSPDAHPGGDESIACEDELDNDCDGLIDHEDPDCEAADDDTSGDDDTTSDDDSADDDSADDDATPDDDDTGDDDETDDDTTPPDCECAHDTSGGDGLVPLFLLVFALVGRRLRRR